MAGRLATITGHDQMALARVLTYPMGHNTHIDEYGSACLWPVSNSFALFSAQTCHKYDVETRTPHSLKTILSDSALICSVSALEYYARHVPNVFGITAALFAVLLEGFSISPHYLIQLSVICRLEASQSTTHSWKRRFDTRIRADF